jgi:hypothetical protein
MKSFNQKFLSLLLLLMAVTSIGNALGQSPQASTASPGKKESAASIDSRSARVLFDEANTYVNKKFEEFNKQKLEYDDKLDARTKQEQKALAAKNAAALQSRKSLTSGDLYYLGMLNHLAGNGDEALEAMRSYLASGPEGENAQVARAVIVLYATRTDLIPEAERAVEAYART